ncbi:MAG: LacI family transcriptional regulator [Acholeplasmataceae bacterium]|jgi:LacI family transcriptional regulator|nr:LacI family transcriptional regulator [Acholeplasmataceae bacterium]
MKKRVTMRDIAKALNISPMTVSKALRDSPDISERMRKNILAKAKELGYVYHDRPAYNIVVFMPEIFINKHDGFYGNLFAKLNREAKLNNISLSLIVLEERDEKQHDFNVDLTNYHGVIFLGEIKKSFIDAVLKITKKIITVDFQYSNLKSDSVVSNNFMGSYYATSYLIKKGHKKINFVGNYRSTASIRDRFLGFQRALLEHNLEFNNSLIINDRTDAGVLIDLELPKELPTAFVCNNDYVAGLIINELKKRKIKVPEQVSVVGFDNTIYSDLCDPKITTVRVPRSTMAEIAIRLLLRRLTRANSTLKNLHVECYLVEKESVNSVK